MHKKFSCVYVITALLLWMCSQGVFSQSATTTIKGVVKDSVTGESLPYVSIQFVGTTTGGMTGNDGEFSISNKQGRTKFTVSYLGYATKELTAKAGKTTNFEILLAPTSVQMQEVVIKPPKRERYRKKDNPAVELIKKVIEHRDDHRLSQKDYYSYEQYEKLGFAINDFAPDLEKKKLLSKFKFLFAYVDTSEFTHKPVLTVSLRERLSNIFHRKDPKTTKTYVLGQRHQGIDQTVEQEGVGPMINETFKDVDIFQNDVYMLFNKFVSPLSKTLATSFYKYYIMDTVMVGGEKCVDLACVPFNNQDIGFTGRLFITLDGTYSVKKIKFNIPRNINLNFVDNLQIEQEFTRLPDSTWVMYNEKTHVSFFLFKSIQGLYAAREKSYRNYNFDPPNDSVFQPEKNWIVAKDALEKPDSFWVEKRHLPLKTREEAIAEMMAELRKVPVFNVIIKTAEIFIAGYVKTGTEEHPSKFDFGPINTTISGNDVEGVRLRLGGTTTANLSKHFFLNGYGAYGTQDREWKYRAEATWAFKPREYHEAEFPMHNLSASYMYDLRTPGQDLYFTNRDNMFLSFKKGTLDKMIYARKLELKYEKENPGSLSYAVWANMVNEAPGGSLRFLKPDLAAGGVMNVKDYNYSEIGVRLRFSKNETYYQNRKNRFPITKEIPVFTLSHMVGIKGFLGGDYNYNHTEFTAQKRFFLSAFGYIDGTLKMGKMWNKVPFPLLIMPNANQTITIQPETFQMMRALEFVSDQYVSWDMSYYMNGWLMNRIPLIRILKFREVFSFRGFYGNLTEKNRPSMERNDLFLLPEGTTAMGKAPYMEVAFGLENILKIMRIDYVWRLNYLDRPGIQRGGFRVMLKVGF
ncbi:MAG: DUF5686 family protein [Bacteroidales bacterium]|nr:DUF5686 family protein [Bacteroidales bacterium]